MGSIDKQKIKERGTLMGSAGLVVALAVACLLNYVGFRALSLAGCLWALGATVVVQGTMWLIVHLRWDARLAPWDPHFIYLPMVGATVLLTLYIYLAPAMRMVLLMAWFGAPALLAGLVGFAGLFAMSALMALGYLGAIALQVRQGQPLSMPFESSVATMFIFINVFAGVVFERLRREREERKALRAKLGELAITDPLTGLYNRRHFEEILRAEVQRIGRYGGNCSLGMIDLDFFKNYNDTLGHLAGDALLRELAALLRGHLRVSDVLARYGGEEFGLIMVNTPKDEAVQGMERLRALVEEYPFRGGSIQPFGRLTVSVGIASCPSDGVEYEELVHKADGALYAAKRMGRNQIQPALLA